MAFVLTKLIGVQAIELAADGSAGPLRGIFDVEPLNIGSLMRDMESIIVLSDEDPLTGQRVVEEVSLVISVDRWGLLVVNGENPTFMSERGRVQMPSQTVLGLGLWKGENGAVQADIPFRDPNTGQETTLPMTLAFVAGGSEYGVQIMGMQDRAFPAYFNEIPNVDAQGRKIFDYAVECTVDAKRKLLYVSDWYEGIKVIDISDPFKTFSADDIVMVINTTAAQDGVVIDNDTGLVYIADANVGVLAAQIFIPEFKIDVETQNGDESFVGVPLGYDGAPLTDNWVQVEVKMSEAMLNNLDNPIEWVIEDDPNDAIDSVGTDNRMTFTPETGYENGTRVRVNILPPLATDGRVPNGQHLTDNSQPLSYRIQATAIINGSALSTSYVTLTQDERDQIRQEYIDMNKNTIPARDEFVNEDTFTNPGNFRFIEINKGDYQWAIFSIADNLQLIRNKITVPMNLNSAYRNPIHNRWHMRNRFGNHVVGARNSRHQYGNAADIDVVDFDGQNGEDNCADWNYLSNVACTSTNGVWVEPHNLAPRWLHFEWNGNTPNCPETPWESNPLTCPPPTNP